MKKAVNFVVFITFLLVPLMIWFNHFKPFISSKDFLFTSLSFLSLALLTMHFILEGKIYIKRGLIYAAVFAYYILNLLSLLLFDYTDSGYFIMLTASVILFYVLSYATDAKSRDMIIHGLFAVSLISSIYGIFQFFGIDYSYFVGYFGTRLEVGTRIFTTFGNPNLQGAFGVFIIPLLCSFLIKYIQEKKKDVCGSILMLLYVGMVFLLAIISLIMSQTRGSWIAFIITMALFVDVLSVRYILLRYKDKYTLLQKKYAWICLFFSILIVYLVVLSLVLYAIFFVANPNQELISPTTADIRMYYYSNSLNMIKDDPLFGKGIGTFNVYYPLYMDKRVAYQKGEVEMEYRVEHPHNEHLEILSDVGIIGYALFMLIVFLALYALLKRGDIISLGISFAIIGLLVDGLMSQNLRHTVIMSLLWLMIGLSTVKQPTGDKQQSVQPDKYGFNIMKIILCLLVLCAVFFPIKHAYNTMHSDYYVKGGTYAYVNGMNKEAVSFFGKALDLDKDNKRALYYIAPSYKQLGGKEEAISYYNRLLSLDPNFIQANFQLGMIYLDDKMYDLAKTYFTKQTRANNMNWQSYYALAVIEMNLGDIDKAISNIDEIEKINSISAIPKEEYVRIMKAKAQLLADAGDYEGALYTLEMLDDLSDDADIDTNLQKLKEFMQGNASG